MRTLFLLGLIGLTACENVEEFIDNDNDSFTADMDCDDNNADINPNAAEICDKVDNNCNGEIDEGASQGLTLYPDTDDDGFGDPEGDTIESCEPVEGYTADSTDCNDNNSAIHPEANEVCDEDSNIDENCNGAIDDDDVFVESQFVLYPDLDQDGFGTDSAEAIVTCHPEPTMFDTHVEDNTDCDDSNARVYPNATEYCDAMDNNCDGSLTDEAGLASWTRDGNPIQNLDFSDATSSVSKQVELTNKGLLAFCPGIFYINLNLSNDITIQGHGTSAPDGEVILSGSDNWQTVITLTNEDETPFHVDIDDVTITNGHANQSFQNESLWGSFLVGGGVYCSGAIDLSITNTRITANYGDYAGGVATENCTVTMNTVELSRNQTLGGNGYCPAALLTGGDSYHIVNSQIYDNAGLYSGAICVGSVDNPTVDLTMDNVQIYENHIDSTASYGTGYLYLFQTSESPGAKINVDLNDTTIFDNTWNGDSTTSGSSAVFINNGEIHLKWTASKVDASGVYGNDTGGMQLMSEQGIQVDIQDVNFGTELGGDNNQVFDLSLNYNDPANSLYYSASYLAEDEATAFCSNHLCGNNADGDYDPSNDRTVHSVGASSSATATASSSFFGGTVLKGTTTNTLKNFSHFYLSPVGCTYDFYIFESADMDGDGDVSDESWEVIWSHYDIVHKGSGGWRVSPFIGKLLPETQSISSGLVDMYYAFAVGWQCDAGSTFAQSYLDEIATSRGDMGMGQSWGTINATSYSTAARYYQGTAYEISASSSTMSSNTPVYVMRVESIDLK